MTRFAERFGYAPPAVDLKPEELPQTLRNGIWDAIRMLLLPEPLEYYVGRELVLKKSTRWVADILWFDYFRESLDSSPTRGFQLVDRLKSEFLGRDFVRFYDLLEYLVNLDETQLEHVDFPHLRNFCNKIFARERSTFRFAENVLVRITDERDIEEIGRAIVQDESVSVARHITRASQLYSDPTSPDYRNSIKESISAVEAAVRYVTKSKAVGVDKPLQEVLDELVLHKAMRAGFEKLYAYTSDESGVRHSLLEDGNEVRQADARYMLIACSAFANYLLALSADRARQP